MSDIGGLHEELKIFVQSIDLFINQNCPRFLTPNSNFLGIIPGHNLDLLQISFDFKVDRQQLLGATIPNELKDPSKTELTVIK
jgi:hypothetical protein